MSAQLWRDVRRLQEFMAEEQEARAASGLPKNSVYRRDAELAGRALDRIVNRLKRDRP